MKYDPQLKLNKHKIAIVLAAAGLLSMGASADHHKVSEGERTYQRQHGSEGDTAYNADEAKAVTFQQLDGRDVVGEDGKDLGSVTDGVIDLDSGEVDSYILSTGLWGIGKEVRIKADRFIGMVDQSGKERINLTKADLNDMEDFDKSSLQDSRELGLISDIIGEDVEGRDGGVAGSVEDVLIDPKRGNVPYVVVRQAPTPLASFRYNYFAVRTDQVKGMKDGELKLAIEDGKMESAPMLSSETDLKWEDGEEVYRYDASGGGVK